MTPNIDLSGLRDIHILSRPPIWPLAYGWWILLISLVVILIVFFAGRYLWRKRPVVYAVKVARNLTKENSNDLTYIKGLSQLLKRVAIAAFGRTTVASLSGMKWQEFLLTQAPDTFSKSEAHAIAFAPYEFKTKTKLPRDIFTDHAILWIKKVLKNKKSS